MSEAIRLFLFGLGCGFACIIGNEYWQWKRQRNLTAAIEKQRIEDRRNAEQEIKRAETEWMPTEIEI